MKYLISIVFLLIQFWTFSQTGEIFIGERRSLVQSKLGKLEISEYEKRHVGYLQEDSIWLYVFFDDDNFCTKHYWLSTASASEKMIEAFKEENWKDTGNDNFRKEGFILSTKTVNKGKNIIYLVEKTIEDTKLAMVDKAALETKKVLEAQPTEPLVKKPNTQAKALIEETNSYQGLTLFGWEIIRILQRDN